MKKNKTCTHYAFTPLSIVLPQQQLDILTVL